MSHLRGIFTEKHVLVLYQYQPSGTFRLGMPQIEFSLLRHINSPFNKEDRP